MVGESKILTVSYGTFSCTLEGFDDPFGTMRGIAEYFRDLAAEDRYFGAEPPTPDAEMLHRIAEREIKRRVESRIGDDGVTLRQLEDRGSDTIGGEPTDNMFADIGVDHAIEVNDADDEAEAADTATAYAANPVEVIEPAPEDNSVAAKLSRIRAVVSRGAATAPPADFSGPIEDAFAGDVSTTAEPVAEDVPDATPANVLDYGAEAEAAAEAITGDLGTPADAGTDTDEKPGEDPWGQPAATYLGAEAPVADMPAAEPEEPATGIAARIVRLKRAALGAAEDAPKPVTAFSPSGVAPLAPFAEVDPAPVEDARAEDIPVASEDAPAVEALEEDAPAEDDTPAADVAEHADDTVEATAEPQPEAEDLDVDVDVDEASEEVAAETPEFDTVAEDNIFAAETDSVPDAQAEAEAQALDAELDAAIDAMMGGRPAEAVDDAPEPEAADAAEATPDVPEEDSLAAMKAAIAAATEAVGSDEARTEAADEDAGDEKISAFEPEEPGDAAFDRILGETNSRMDDSEGNRRRSAIAHLKAAVAATKADRLLKRMKQPEEQAAEEQSQYRDDLAKVVRPNRPETDETDEADKKTERPQMLEDKPSPLMLVSELRVDDGDMDAEPVAPRRPEDGGASETEVEYDQGFAEFAKQMGADELSDLLEAAAAYSAFVEGQKEFSRPQLMRRVAGLEGGDHSREQGLRSFGQLLRQGKIQKLKRGQFTITAETRFNPEARIAGE